MLGHRQTLLLGIWVLVNVPLSLWTIYWNAFDQQHIDWRLFIRLETALESGHLYAEEPLYVWSPVAAWLLAYVIVPLGLPVWTTLHFVALAFLRSWPLIGLTLVSAAFWTDVSAGHMFVFVFVAAVGALRGSWWSTVAYIALTLLAPRPVQVPLLVWLLWRHPASRIPFVILFAVHAAILLFSGYAFEWVAAAGTISEDIAGSLWDWGPTYLLGRLWLLIGIPLAVILTWRGWAGVAGLAASPYWLPQYWLFVLLDAVVRRADPAPDASRTVDPPHPGR